MSERSYFYETEHFYLVYTPFDLYVFVYIDPYDWIMNRYESVKDFNGSFEIKESDTTVDKHYED